MRADTEPIVTQTELPGDPKDDQSRYIEAAVNGVIVTSLYAPNGNPQPGPKFTYKLAWMERLIRHAAELHAAGVPVVLAGDYNVVPTDKDIYPTKSYADNALVQPRAARAVSDACSARVGRCDPDAAQRADVHVLGLSAEPMAARCAGCRLDHLLLSPEAAKLLVAAGVDRDVRGEDGASDHAPAWIILKDRTKVQRKSPPALRRPATKAKTSEARQPAAARHRRR